MDPCSKKYTIQFKGALQEKIIIYNKILKYYYLLEKYFDIIKGYQTTIDQTSRIIKDLLNKF